MQITQMAHTESVAAFFNTSLIAKLINVHKAMQHHWTVNILE